MGSEPENKELDKEKLESEAEKEYAAFEDSVKRTVYIDNLSPLVTEGHIRAAFSQFHGTLTNIHIFPNYIEPNYTAKCALLEYENQEQAQEIIELVSTHLLMILGMPRPVRAIPATPEMFDDHPKKPGSKIHLYWVKPDDPDFEEAQKLKKLAEKHIAQQSFVLKKQLEQEEELSKTQAQTLKTHYAKYEKINSVISEDATKRLARQLGIRLKGG